MTELRTASGVKQIKLQYRIGGWNGVADYFIHAPVLRHIVPQKLKDKICDEYQESVLDSIYD